jgi:hypothetical protein
VNEFHSIVVMTSAVLTVTQMCTVETFMTAKMMILYSGVGGGDYGNGGSIG